MPSWILLVCCYHPATTASAKSRKSYGPGQPRQHQCITTPLLWLVVGPPARKKARHDTAPAQDEKGTAAQHHSLLRCRPPWPARHIAESSTHGRGRGAGFRQSSFTLQSSALRRARPRNSLPRGSSWEKSRTRDRNDQRSYRDGMRRNTHDTSV